MTYKQFLAALRKTPRRWRIDNDFIRCRGGLYDTCPITEVSPNHTHPKNWISAARLLGLRPSVAKRVVIAADDWGNQKTRRDLLKACGLKEPA